MSTRNKFNESALNVYFSEKQEKWTESRKAFGLKCFHLSDHKIGLNTALDRVKRRSTLTMKHIIRATALAIGSSILSFVFLIPVGCR